MMARKMPLPHYEPAPGALNSDATRPAVYMNPELLGVGEPLKPAGGATRGWQRKEAHREGVPTMLKKGRSWRVDELACLTDQLPTRPGCA